MNKVIIGNGASSSCTKEASTYLLPQLITAGRKLRRKKGLNIRNQL